MKRLLLVTICWFWFLTLAWAVDVRTAVLDVSHESPYATIGHFTLVVNSDAFAGAGPDNPIYIRFTLTHSRGWSKTLVDLREGATHGYQDPINIAVYPESGTLNPNIPETAVQLVRLIKDEREAWLRITDSSSDWVMGGTGSGPPSATTPVALAVGLRGPQSVRPGANTDSGGNEIDSFLVSTEMCVNYRNTPGFGAGDVERISFLAVDSTTFGVEDEDFVVLGANTGIGFSDDPVIARGVDNFPCFEYHFDPENFVPEPFQLEISRFNQVDLHEFQHDLPAVYFTNSSDFVWEAGSSLVLVNPNFAPGPFVFGQEYSRAYEPELPETRLRPTEVVLETFSGFSQTAQWQVIPIIYKENLMGYQFKLLAGSFPVGSQIRVTHLGITTGEDFAYRPLTLMAFGYYINQTVTEGTLQPLGPLLTKTAVLSRAEQLPHRKIVPFTAHDRDDLDFEIHLVNKGTEAATVTTLFYNRHGILLRLMGRETFQPFEKRRISILEEYGIRAAEVLSWVEILSDQPVAVAGVTQGKNREVLDVLPAVSEFNDVLYAPHVPSYPNIWETRAYLLSSDPEKDTDFFIQLPGQEESGIQSILFPGGTAVLKDRDFEGASGRSPWFQINATQSTASGLMTYSHVDGTQLASVTMNEQPKKTWRYDHVGDFRNLWWNGLALLNHHEFATQITLSGLDETNTPIASTSLTLEPQSNLVKPLVELLPEHRDTPFARLIVKSDREITSFLLIGQLERALLTTISGNIPMSFNGILPYLPNLTDHWVGMVFINDQTVDSQITVTLHDEQGGVLAETRITNAALSKRIFMLSDILPQIENAAFLSFDSDRLIRAFSLTGDLQRRQLATLAFEVISLP